MLRTSMLVSELLRIKGMGMGVLAKVLRAAVGNSMSISWRSWLKRFKVTPESVLTKNAMGALRTVFRRAKWNFSPDRGTMVMIICLGGC